jgi:hypothetical protein
MLRLSPSCCPRPGCRYCNSLPASKTNTLFPCRPWTGVPELTAWSGAKAPSHPARRARPCLDRGKKGRGDQCVSARVTTRTSAAGRLLRGCRPYVECPPFDGPPVLGGVALQGSAHSNTANFQKATVHHGMAAAAAGHPSGTWNTRRRSCQGCASHQGRELDRSGPRGGGWGGQPQHLVPSARSVDGTALLHSPPPCLFGWYMQF